MKRLILLLVIVAVALSMVSCGGIAKKNNSKITIVTTIFPQYDWVREIVGDNSDIDIVLLQKNGVDLHSYQPKAKDIVTISSCDMFVYIGGESDDWVDEVIATANNKNMVVVNLLECLGDDAKDEELKEGMEHEHEHDEEDEDEHDEDHDHDEEHEHEAEKDEHIWLSLKNAKKLCNILKDKICEIDPDNKAAYSANCSKYVEKIEKLDKSFKDTVSAAKTKTVLFGDRFPFRYLFDDYGLDYFAAFSGCSAESEASIPTIAFLVKKVDDLGLKFIVKLEDSNGKIASTIKDSSAAKDQEVLTMYSIQAVTSTDISNGITYLGEMEKNLETLKKALG
ncbi:MAG: metal ABC transporter substrate-binding protein [Clostridia bacterium]|nr:metal ABC transporter substrate-binding protein [Clostridia bacterium]